MEEVSGNVLAWLFVGGALAVGFAVSVLLAMMFRRVVPTNEVHIIQSRKRTTSYGKDYKGNTYYQWPSWVPLLGITKVVLPVSNFDVDLHAYEAYDKGRLPFVVDVKAFFRIAHSDVAAQRVASFAELHQQLQAVVQGAVRTILASSDIEEIMQGRSKFGVEFTKEVAEQLSNWGVETVKNIELMDIRDSKDSPVIQNIMAKKKSHIEMESRQEVARNKRQAEITEIEARRDVESQKQEAAQAVGMRTVQAEQQVELARESKLQVVKEQQRTTKEKEMAVLKVDSVKKAEIEKEVQVVKASQDKETLILVADGHLAAKKKEAEGIAAEGEAKASAEKAMQLAPVEAQIVLAKEIGGNKSYQEYLVTIRQVEAAEKVGVEQAAALEHADVRVISNAGTPAEGVTKVMDLFSPAGGAKIVGMMETLSAAAAKTKKVLDPDKKPQ